MSRSPVTSSNLRSVGYEAATQTLEIEFHSSGIYQYFSVPPSVHEALMHAPSKGSYFAGNIKGTYRYRKVR